MGHQLKIKFDRIYRNSIGYNLLKAYINFTHNIINYRKIYVIGEENMPQQESVIVTPNHQNALMDALAVNHPLKGFNVFLARSDIFQKTFLAIVLRFIKIMPVYRLRDGASNLQKNSEIFENAVKVLRCNRRLAIFPEGNHSGYRHVRPLKKGVARIAFQAGEHLNFEKNINILPVGIDYTDYQKFRQTLVVRIGKPIELNSYLDLYNENPQKAMTRLIRDIRQQIIPLALNIKTDDYYDTADQLRRLFNNDVLETWGNTDFSRPEQLKAEQKIVDAVQRKEEENTDLLTNLHERVKAYTNHLKQMKIRDWVVRRDGGSALKAALKALLLVLLSPVFLYGYINNLIIYHLTVGLGNKIKDPQFVNSVKFVFYSFVGPLVYLAQLGVLGIFVEDFWWRLGYFVSIPLTGYWAFSIYIHTKKVLGQFRYHFAPAGVRQKIWNMRDTLKNDVLALVNEMK